MDELDMLGERSAPAPILVTVFDDDVALEALAASADLRRGGLGAELYPSARKLGAQLKYANRRGHRLAVIIGPDEVAAGTAQLKNLQTGRSVEVPRVDLAAACRSELTTDD